MKPKIVLITFLCLVAFYFIYNFLPVVQNYRVEKEIESAFKDDRNESTISKVKIIEKIQSNGQVFYVAECQYMSYSDSHAYVHSYWENGMRKYNTITVGGRYGNARIPIAEGHVIIAYHSASVRFTLKSGEIIEMDFQDELEEKGYFLYYIENTEQIEFIYE